MKKKQEYGQYFTTAINLQEKVYEFIKNKPEKILEPSVGRGDLVNYIISENPNIKFDMFEIDSTIKLLKKIKNMEVNYEDFLDHEFDKKKYETIIGNPPYVKTSNGNLYIKFISKCYKLLDNGGELIFIIPSDFFKVTSSAKILNKMMKNGTFTHIYHPDNEHLFENASIDIIIFGYCKKKTLKKIVIYNGKKKYIVNSNGMITFEDVNNDKYYKISDIFKIYVGLVSGRESVFKNEKLGNIVLLNGENKKNKYILISQFPSDDKKINNYLLSNKDVLLERKIRKFNNNNWFEWGAPRNISIMKNDAGKDCIYIYNMTRKKNVAFVGNVEYFGGNLMIMIPKKKN